MTPIKESNFNFPGQTSFYKGKVRDVYTIRNEILVMVVTDRISAFDVVLPKAIPFKGRVLNLIASKSFKETEDILPNWLLGIPHPNVSIGRIAEPFKVEMVIRAYLSGHAWREYNDGKRVLSGVQLPEGLKENDKLPELLITPSTKASIGHDEDISRDEIVNRNIVSEADYIKLEAFTKALFKRGTEIAAKRGMILADTKYEFGKYKNEILLIDEIHTPDSSRYFYADGYQSLQDAGKPQKQLSKEFVRKWLIENGFQGKEGQQIPEMTDLVVNSISNRYLELYKQITGEQLESSHANRDTLSGIESNILKALEEFSA